MPLLLPPVGILAQLPLFAARHLRPVHTPCLAPCEPLKCNLDHSVREATSGWTGNPTRTARPCNDPPLLSSLIKILVCCFVVGDQCSASLRIIAVFDRLPVVFFGVTDPVSFKTVEKGDISFCLSGLSQPLVPVLDGAAANIGCIKIYYKPPFGT